MFVTQFGVDCVEENKTSHSELLVFHLKFFPVLHQWIIKTDGSPVVDHWHVPVSGVTVSSFILC